VLGISEVFQAAMKHYENGFLRLGFSEDSYGSRTKLMTSLSKEHRAQAIRA
jgi:hypothetical protein